jgi:hypothetical protein
VILECNTERGRCITGVKGGQSGRREKGEGRREKGEGRNKEGDAHVEKMLPSMP